MILKAFKTLKKLRKSNFCLPLPDKTIEWTKEPQPRTYTKTNYFSDPEDIALRVSSIIALHDNLKTEDIRLTHTFEELGLEELDKIDIIFALEMFFDMSIPPEHFEKFKNVYDVVQYLSKSMFVH